MLTTVEQVTQGRTGPKDQKQKPPQRGHPKRGEAYGSQRERGETNAIGVEERTLYEEMSRVKKGREDSASHDFRSEG